MQDEQTSRKYMQLLSEFEDLSRACHKVDEALKIMQDVDPNLKPLMDPRSVINDDPVRMKWIDLMSKLTDEGNDSQLEEVVDELNKLVRVGDPNSRDYQIEREELVGKYLTLLDKK